MQTHFGLLTPRAAVQLRGVSLFVLATTAVFATGSVAIDGRLVPRMAGWVFVLATAILGILTIASYLRFLRTGDELLRRIHVEALALAFGTGAVFMLTYRLCERLGALKLDSNDPLAIMAIAWGIGLWLGVRRYTGGGEE